MGGFSFPNPFKSNDPPAAPDPNKVTQGQVAVGQQVQGANAPDQTGVFGNTQYTHGANGGITGVNTSLNPQYQGVMDSLLGGLGTQPGATSDAVYGQYASRLDPKFAQGETDLDTRLANQGIPVGSEAWAKAKDQFGRDRNDAYATAQRNSVTAGSDERTKLLQGIFGLGNLANAGYANIPQIATPNKAGYQYQNFGAQQDAYNQDVGQSNMGMQGLFGLGSAFLSNYNWGG